MSIPRRGLRARVPEYLPDRVQIHSGVNQHRGAAMPEVVEVNVFHPRLLPSRVKPFDKQAVGAVQG